MSNPSSSVPLASVGRHCPDGTKGFSKWAAARAQGDPTYTIHGDFDGARRDGAECLARDPASVACRLPLLTLDAYEGRCEDTEREGRTLAATNPDDGNGYAFRALGLGGSNGQVVAVADLVERSIARSPPWARASMQRNTDVALPIYVGDLETARRAAHAASVGPAAPEADHSLWATTEVTLAFESGDVRGGGELAMKLLALRGAQPATESLAGDYEIGLWLRAAYEAKLISLATFREKRNAWLDAWHARTEARIWPVNKRVAWLALSSSLLDTLDHDEAVEVIDNLGVFDFRHWINPYYAPMGGSLLLAVGRIDDAIQPLETGSRPCTYDIFTQMRPSLDLGRARALKGDRAGACKAFEKVLLRWGHAKPRSVTADKARAETAKLGCDPVP